MRTLVIHTAFPGDLILATPLLERLRREPDQEWLGLLTRPGCAALFAGDPRLDELILYAKNGADAGLAGFLRLARRLRGLGVDRVVSPHRSLRSSLLALASGAFERVGFSSATGSLVYTELVFHSSGRHEIERNLSLAGALDEGAEPALPSLHNDAAEEARVRALFDQEGLQMPVALAPASLWETKRWPAAHFGRLAEQVLEATPADIVLLGGPEDHALCEAVREPVHPCRRPRVHNLAGRLHLRESYQALRLCRLAVVNDSAPLHLAQAARIPTLAVFGSTVPEFGFGPRGPRDQVFQQKLDCVPCGIHGHRRCPLGTLACLEGLDPGLVARAAIAELDPGRAELRP